MGQASHNGRWFLAESHQAKASVIPAIQLRSHAGTCVDINHSIVNYIFYLIAFLVHVYKRTPSVHVKS